MPVTINGTTGIAGPDGSASTPAVQGTDSNTGLFFPAADTVGVTTGGAEAARINSSGTLILKGGSTSATGVGITFPADTTTTVSSNANTLDDYEEGTWTPSLGGNTTYSDQTGVYTKVGRQVTAKFRINVTSIGTGSTTAITGLPFTVGSGYEGAFAPYFETTATNIVTLVGLSSVTSIYLYSATAATASLGSNAIFKNGTTINGIVTYFV